MVKRIIIIASAVFLVLLLVEVSGLLQLRSHLKSYARYWQHRAHEPGDFTYVALGDSAAQGIGASLPERGYVGLIAQRIAEVTGKKVRVINLSVSGARVADVLKVQLPQLSQYHPDLVTVEVGANDVLHFDEAQYRADYQKLMQGLPKGSMVANVPYFGGRKSGEDATARLASSIADQSIQAYGLHRVDLAYFTRVKNSPRNYSYDFFHPSNYGYRVWFEAYWTVIGPILSAHCTSVK